MKIEYIAKSASAQPLLMREFMPELIPESKIHKFTFDIDEGFVVWDLPPDGEIMLGEKGISIDIYPGKIDIRRRRR